MIMKETFFIFYICVLHRQKTKQTTTKKSRGCLMSVHDAHPRPALFKPLETCSWDFKTKLVIAKGIPSGCCQSSLDNVYLHAFHRSMLWRQLVKGLQLCFNVVLLDYWHIMCMWSLNPKFCCNNKKRKTKEKQSVSKCDFCFTVRCVGWKMLLRVKL